MKNKWASCLTNGQLNFNLELLDFEKSLGEYVIIHELVHFRAPNHGPLWKSYMNLYLPGWELFDKRVKRCRGETHGEGAIKEIKPSDSNRFIYRARQADNNNLRKQIWENPSQELGSPPHEKTTAGRMNPAGIPVFYGSIEKDTCIAEIRLPVGGSALVGKFEIIRPIKVLDLTILDKGLYDKKLSMLDPNYEHIVSQQDFLNDFHQEIMKPVLPCDEILDYLPTQAIAEYLAKQFTPKLDGIIYSSAQISNGLNLALFNHARMVKSTKKNKSSLSKYEFEFEQTDYGRFIITKRERIKHKGKLSFLNTPLEPELEIPSPTLRYCEGSLELVQITSIKEFNYKSSPIIYYDLTKRIEGIPLNL